MPIRSNFSDSAISAHRNYSVHVENLRLEDKFTIQISPRLFAMHLSCHALPARYTSGRNTRNVERGIVYAVDSGFEI